MEPKVVITIHVIRKLNFGKRKGLAFTLIELLVVIAIIALLMAILIPALGRAKDQAKNVVCLSRLKQFSLMYEMYAQDNDDSLPGGWTSKKMWMTDLLPYYGGTDDVRLCPKATKFLHLIPLNKPGVFTAWGIMGNPDYLGGNIPDWGQEGLYGSYGVNGWAFNPPDVSLSKDDYIDPDELPLFWRKKTNVKRPDTVPLMGGSMYDGSRPKVSNTPPPEEGMQTNEMSDFCLPRHNGKVNMMFIDTSARSVGLKELWSLKWHPEWKTPRINWSRYEWINKYPD